MPLSPNQHRLTEDGELDKSVAAGDLFVSNNQIGKNALVMPRDTPVSQAEQHIQAELGTTDLQDVHQQALTASTPPAVQKVTEQIKVPFHCGSRSALHTCVVGCILAHRRDCQHQLVAHRQTLMSV